MIRTRVALLALSLCTIVAAAQAADRTRVVNEGGIRDQWMLADGIKLAAPGYPAQYKDRGDSVCVAVAYAIKPDGTTGDFAVLKEWSSAADAGSDKAYFDAFAQAGAGALSQWKFKPRPEVTNPQRTVTVATMNFGGKDSAEVVATRAHCQISDLAAAIQEASHSRADRDHLRRDLERSQRAGSANQSMVSNPAGSLGAPVR